VIVEESANRRRESIKAYLNRIIPYQSETIVASVIPFYDRWDDYRTVVSETQTVVNDALDEIKTMRARVVQAIDELRTGGLGKKFLGEYKDCLEYFRKGIKNGMDLGHKEVGLLATYFLMSHYSYAETFAKGEAS